jgi:hypothetical protein
MKNPNDLVGNLSELCCRCKIYVFRALFCVLEIEVMCDSVQGEVVYISGHCSPIVQFVCPCGSNAEHSGLLSEVSVVMCVDVVSDQPTDRTSSSQS